MEGYSDPPELKIIPNSFAHIFDAIKSRRGNEIFGSRLVSGIYNEEIRDLLSTDYSTKLEVREHVDSGVYVEV